jgi:hypothetical protein
MAWDDNGMSTHCTTSSAGARASSTLQKVRTLLAMPIFVLLIGYICFPSPVERNSRVAQHAVRTWCLEMNCTLVADICLLVHLVRHPSATWQYLQSLVHYLRMAYVQCTLSMTSTFVLYAHTHCSQTLHLPDCLHSARTNLFVYFSPVNPVLGGLLFVS